MALQKQLLPLQIGPLNQKGDKKLSVTLDLLENMYAQKEGNLLELRKRNGGSALSRTIDGTASGYGTLATGKRLFTFGSELLLADGRFLFSWSEVAQKWRPRARLPMAHMTEMPVYGVHPSGKADLDVAIAGNLMAVSVFVPATGVFRLYLIDRTTGQLIGSDTSGSVPTEITGRTPRVVASSSAVFVLYHDGGANILIRKIDAATPSTLGAAVTVATDAHTTLRYDAVYDPVANLIYLAYRRNTGTHISFQTITTTPATSGASVAWAANPDKAIGWLSQPFTDSKAVFAFASSTAGIESWAMQPASAWGRASNWGNDATATTARHVTGWWDLSAPTVLWEIPGAATHNTVVRWQTGGGVAAADLMRSVGLASRAWTVSGSPATAYRVLIAYESTVQKTTVMLELGGVPSTQGGFTIGAVPRVGNGSGLTPSDGALPSVATVSSADVAVPIGVWDGEVYGARVATVSTDQTKVGKAATFAGSLFIPGAMLTQYDGSQAVEAGFLVYPEAPTLTAGAGGTMTPSATYKYMLTYRWRDTSGRLWRSSPSAVASVTLGGAQNSCSLACSRLRLSMKNDRGNLNRLGLQIHRVEIEIWRTTGNGDNWRLRAVISNESTPAGDTETFNDTGADSVLDTAERLYTDAGEAEHVAPGNVSIVHPWRNRLFAVVDGTDLWFTKEVEEGYGANFSDVLRMPLDGADGPITALDDFDERLVIGHENALRTLTGAGPDDTGDPMYDIPGRVETQVGPASPRAIASTTDGLLVQTAKGPHLLDRGLGMAFVGAQVEDESVTVVAGVADETRSWARLFSAGGRTLVYDAEFTRRMQRPSWYVFTNQAAVDAVVWSGVVCHLRSDGTVIKEVAGQYHDNTTDVVFKLRLGWISGAGVLGFQRVFKLLILGEYIGQHTLRVTPARDFGVDDTAKTIVPSATPPYRFEVPMKEQRCSAVRFTIDESQVGFNSGGPRISALALLVGIKGPARPLAASKRLT